MKREILGMACGLQQGWPGDVEMNGAAVLRRVKQAREAGAQLLALPALCLSGAGLQELYAHPLLTEACFRMAERIAREARGLCCVFGLPLAFESRVYSALAVAREGRIQALILGDRYEAGARAFVADQDKSPYEGAQIAGIPLVKRLSFLFEDEIELSILPPLLNPAHFGGFSPGKRLFVLSSALPAKALGRETDWPGLCGALPRGAAGLVYANAGLSESSAEALYDGASFLFINGRLASQSLPFEEAPALADLLKTPLGPEGLLKAPEMAPLRPYAPKDPQALLSWGKEAIEIAARGLALRLERTGLRRVTLGVSGGLDSAMALIICKRCFEILGLPDEGIIALSLPALGSSAHTRDSAFRLLGACGLPEREIDLKNAVLSHFKDIQHPIDRYDAAYENAQARERTQVLMDLANMENALMVGTGDLSELALGFTTYGGDQMSMYGVCAGLYKSAIRLILAGVARTTPKVPLKSALIRILETPVSPELLPLKDGEIKQKTEEVLGPYLLNDFFLHYFLSERMAPKELLQKATAVFGEEYSPESLHEALERFFTRFFQSQFKRAALPEAPAILGLSLSPRSGFLMPSDTAATLWLNELKK